MTSRCLCDAPGDATAHRRLAEARLSTTIQGMDAHQNIAAHVLEAERLGHSGIGCEHLLLGILANKDGLAARALGAHGVSLDRVRERTAEIVADGWQAANHRKYSPRATAVRTLARVEAERLDQRDVTDTHLLLAILTEGESIPVFILDEMGVDLDKLRADLITGLDVSKDVARSYLTQRESTETRRVRRWQGPSDGHSIGD